MTNTSLQLVSVGYEGRNVDDLVALLMEEQVDTLVDVRLNPISRKPGLSKTALGMALDQAGIAYVHVRDLGNPKDNREGYRAGDLDALETYDRILRSSEGTLALQHVSELLEGGTVALLCFERDHRQCHRHQVMDRLDSMIEGLQVALA